MKNTFFSSIAALIIVAMISISSAAFALTPQERITSSINAVQEISDQEDVETMAYLVKNSHGVVIIPNFYKAAIGVGGSYGEGLVLRHNPATNRWYGPSFMNITGASYGLQIGVQSTALLLVITNEAGMKHFYGDTVKLGANVDVAAGPVGRSAGAATDINLKASIYSYSISKGLFAGLSLGGSVMSTDVEANNSFWGSKYNSRTILKKRATSNSVKPLLAALNKLSLKSTD